MRKSGSLLLTLAVLCLALLGEGAPAFAQAPAIGRVEALVGTAVVTRQATGAAGPLTVGDELFEGDRIRTDIGSRLRLALRDGSVLSCGEATGLTLALALYAPEQNSRNYLLRVSFGIVRAVVELLAAALLPDYIVLGGGNVKELEALPRNCRQGTNANAFVGGFRLWQPPGDGAPAADAASTPAVRPAPASNATPRAWPSTRGPLPST